MARRGTACPPDCRKADIRAWLGAIARSVPLFLCRALVGREVVLAAETAELVDKLYVGSVDKLFAALLSPGKLDREQVARLRKMVDELE